MVKKEEPATPEEKELTISEITEGRYVGLSEAAEILNITAGNLRVVVNQLDQYRRGDRDSIPERVKILPTPQSLRARDQIIFSLPELHEVAEEFKAKSRKGRPRQKKSE